MKEHKHIEIYEHIHKGISVLVKIDYFTNEISLLEDKTMQRKEWIFAKRGVEYMNGWINILEAMQEAIKHAKKKYEANLAEESKFRNKDFNVEIGYKIKKLKKGEVVKGELLELSLVKKKK